MANLLHRLKINEVSSVKRGAGEGVKVVLMKIDRDAKRPDGGPVIKANTSMVWFMKTAIEMGAPIAKVAKAEVAMNETVAAIESTIQGEAEQTSALETSLTQCVDHLAGIVPPEKADDFRAAVAAVTEESIMPTEAEKAAALKKDEDLQKTLDAMQKSNAALTRQVAILSMSKEHQDYLPVMPFEAAELTTAQDKFIAATPQARDETIKAWPPKKKPGGGSDTGDSDEDDTKKAFEKALAESPVMKALMNENAELKKKDEIAVFAKEAVSLGLPESHGEVMYKMAKGDKEAIKTHQQMIKSLVEQARTGKLFVEFGKDNGGDNNQPAYETIKAKADELRKTDPKLSPQQARVKVMTDPENAELVARNKSEENARRLGRVA